MHGYKWSINCTRTRTAAGSDNENAGASSGALAVAVRDILARAMRHTLEGVRRAATHGLVALGSRSTECATLAVEVRVNAAYIQPSALLCSL